MVRDISFQVFQTRLTPADCQTYPLTVPNRLTSAGTQLVTISAKPSDLFVKWLGILSTKSCFRMVGWPLIKSMLVGSNSVVGLSSLIKSKLNTTFFLLTIVCAPVPARLTAVCWWRASVDPVSNNTFTTSSSSGIFVPFLPLGFSLFLGSSSYG